jgi:alpha-amylase
MRYVDVMGMMDEVVRDGYSHIQLSPSQRSITEPPKSEPKASNNEWWFRYQPIEFVIGNYYGSKDELYALTQMAHKAGINVISDVCLNFVAELKGVSGKDWDDATQRKDHELLKRYNELLNSSYPPFTIEDFKPRYRYDEKSGRFIKQWYMGNLPGLNMESPKVQGVHFRYLEDLVKSGIDGFRFDCAQWMRPDTMNRYFNNCRTQWSYMEVTEKKNIKRIQTYNKIGPISDYSLGLTLGRIFSSKELALSDDLRKLDKIVAEDNVTFAVNHDTYHSEQSRLRLDFPDNADRSTEVLATVVTIVMKNGVPLVFRETAKDPVVKTAVRFRKLMSDLDAPDINVFRTDDIKVVALSRGNYGLCLINSGRHTAKINTIKEFPNGELSSLTDSEQIGILNGRSNRYITIQPKSARFYTVIPAKQDDHAKGIFSILDFPPLAKSTAKK